MTGDAALFYLLVCRECGAPDRPLAMPFGSPAERGKWASGHTTATGHDRWFVTDTAERLSTGTLAAMIARNDDFLRELRGGINARTALGEDGGG